MEREKIKSSPDEIAENLVYLVVGFFTGFASGTLCAYFIIATVG